MNRSFFTIFLICLHSMTINPISAFALNLNTRTHSHGNGNEKQITTLYETPDEKKNFQTSVSRRAKTSRGNQTGSQNSLRANRFQTSRTRRITLLRPVRILENDDSDGNYHKHKRLDTRLQISTGLTFDDGDQLLVSAQKPLGMVLEERGEGKMGCIVSQVVEGGAADRSGVRMGDFLAAVQNVDVGQSTFEEVMDRIASAPKVVNLRFWRRERSQEGHEEDEG